LAAEGRVVLDVGRVKGFVVLQEMDEDPVDLEDVVDVADAGEVACDEVGAGARDGEEVASGGVGEKAFRC
jgi:hypothetical protein